MGYDAVEHAILDNIRTVMLGKTIEKLEDHYIKARIANVALEKRMFRKDDSLIPMVS